MRGQKDERRRYIIVSPDCPGCQQLKEAVEPRGFEYVELEEAEPLLEKTDLGDTISIPLALECTEDRCQVCELDVKDGRLVFRCPDHKM